MHISKIELKNFKRFTDLTIDLSLVKPLPKLVLMIGANGSGKSSLFDAFEWSSLDFKERVSKTTPMFQTAYHGKDNKKAQIEIKFANQATLKQFWENENVINCEFTGTPRSDLFYGRSAFRHSPYITTNTKTANISADTDRPQFLIDSDQRFVNDVPAFINKILSEVFNEKNKIVGEVLRERYIEPINRALGRIFGNEQSTSLSLVNISLPTVDDFLDITFKKGSSTFGYELLSSGEKEVFGILLNLLVRRDSFQDTIYFIDELDVHLNTSLQYAFLKEVTENWIPQNCQLWTASHSLGFIQYARETENAVIIDFDQFDFDVPQILLPQPKDNLEVYEIAVPKGMLSEIFQDKLLTFCENTDVIIYNSIGLKERLFLPATDKNDVYFSAKNNPNLFGLMDKDFLTPREIEAIRQKISNLFILTFYSIESYLYHPENLAEAISNFEMEKYQEDLKKQKNTLYEKVIFGLKGARDSYKVLSFEKVKIKNAEEDIFTALKSDSFEDFYPYLDMKKTFKHGNYNISDRQLAQTNWFNQEISKIFKVT